MVRREAAILPDTQEDTVPHRDRPAHIPWSVGEYKGVCIAGGWSSGREAHQPEAHQPPARARGLGGDLWASGWWATYDSMDGRRR